VKNPEQCPKVFHIKLTYGRYEKMANAPHFIFVQITARILLEKKKYKILQLL